MSNDYSENILIQESACNLLHNELGWNVQLAYNAEILGKDGTLAEKIIMKSFCFAIFARH